MEGVKLTGLWEKTDKNGNTYFSGKLNAYNHILIMKNGFKDSEEAPDYFLHVTPVTKDKSGK